VTAPVAGKLAALFERLRTGVDDVIRQPTTLSTATTVQLAHRLLVQREHPTWPFFWRGFAPAIGLLAVLWYAFFPFRTDAIEHEVRQEVRAALDARGMQWVSIEVDGQDVRLAGSPPGRSQGGPAPSGGSERSERGGIELEPRDDAGKAAIAVVRDVRCRTWFIALRCVAAVHDGFAKGPAPAGTSDPAIRLTPDAATAASGPMLAAREPSREPTRDAAREGERAEPDRAAANAGNERAAGVAIAAGAAPTPLSEPTTARGCEARISSLLAGASIQFTAGEAMIDASSDPLLDRISQAIRSCPGVVRIEGHSDTSGNAVTNHALSMARAKAVREVMLQLGLPETKVEAVGLGSSRPVAPNDTPESRALNRRIEFHAL
jgi:outer membrane protein OmpA-like peptidoglycan-associated protein